MKAISLWQPWASLIAAGLKPYETRHWSPAPGLIGQRIAIHAAKKIDREIVDYCQDVMEGEHAARIADSFGATPTALYQQFGRVLLPAGCIVATAILDAAFLLGEPASGTAVPAAKVVRRWVSRPMPDCFTVRYDAWGDYSPGRWAWLLRDVRPVKPAIATVGRQGFWDLPGDCMPPAEQGQS